MQFFVINRRFITQNSVTLDSNRLLEPEVVEGPLVELEPDLQLAVARLVAGLAEVELEAVYVEVEAELGPSIQ
jgi:hypothetical protein